MKTILITLVFLLTFLGCGEKVTINLTEVFSCSVEETDLGVTILCPDGTSAFLEDGTIGDTGSQGSDGIDGFDGQDGIDGSSCHVEQEDDCARIFCDDGSEAVLCTEDEPPCSRPHPPGWC